MIDKVTPILLCLCRKKPTLKILLSIAVLLVFFNNKANAQVGVYSFTQNIIGYTALAGTPTTVYPAPWDDHVSGAAYQITMPFTFVYDNNSYTQFYVSPNGFITFGVTQPAPTNYGPLNNTTAYTGAISALGVDLISNGSAIVYDVIGTAPNRTVVVQWTDATRKSTSGNFNFQIRLNETVNTIDLSYGLCQPTGATNVPVQVGLRGQNNVIAQGNVFNRLHGSNSTWFGSTISGTANSSTVRTLLSAYPDLGLDFKYTPAPACTTPIAQPSGLILGATSIKDVSINGNSFTAASPAPTNYLVLRSTVNTPPTAANVINRTYYALNAVISATYTVVSNTNATSFSQASGLTPDTTYYYWVIPYNDLCTGAPFYFFTGIISANATTCSAATTSQAATSIGGNSFVANWSNVPTATNYIIDVSTNNTFTALVPGYSNLSVATNSLTVTGLLPLTTYYYRVKAIGTGCTVTSATQTVTTTCGYYNIPYTQNFDTFATGIIPPCYTRLDANADGFQWQTQSINYSSASRSMHMSKNPTQAMNDWFFLPGLNLTGGTSYRLFFRYNTGNTASFVENLRVSLGNAANIASMSEILLDLSNINNSVFQVAIVDFVPVTSGVYYIGFQGLSPANQSYLVIDDISVTLSPNCFEPTEVSIASVGTTSANVTWIASVPPPTNGYEYYLSTSNTPPTGATVPTGSVGAGITSLNLTGLLPSTFYYVWVRGNCSAVDKSIWTSEESFGTECSTPTIISTTPASRCGYGTATLNATSSVGASISWYAASSGGTTLATGNSYTTPAISSTTTYYVEAKSFGSIAKVGAQNPVVEGGIIGTQNFQSAVVFSVLSNTSLQSIDIYPLVSGQAGQLVLRNSSNVTLATYSFTTSASGGSTAQAIPINYTFQPGSYNLYFATVPAAGVRMNTTNAFYPYTSSVANIMGNTTDSFYFLGFYNWKFTTECLSPRIAVTATVSAPPSLTLSSSSSTICEGETSPTITVTGYAAYNSLVWSPSTGVSGSLATGFTFNPITTTTYTLLANQTSGSFCGNILTHTVTVKPLPAAIMVVPSAATTCENSIQPLNGSAGASAAIPIFTETFNGASSWTVANTSVGGDTNASQWTLRPNSYHYINGFGWDITFNSNDNSQFYLANSDAQSASPGTITKTTLTSPSLNLVGYTSASVSLWHYLRYISGDIVLVQASTDGGTTWNTVKTYVNSQGTYSTTTLLATFVNDTIDLTSYIGNANVKLRFSFTSQWGYVWAIDNVLVSGTLAAALTWSPATGLYTDAGATIPYTLGTPLSVVYAKPSITTVYTATITGSNGCFRSNSSTITVVPSTVAGTVSSDQSLCSGATASNLTLSGNVGSVVRWEYADDAAFTVNVTPIANTTTTLTAAQMGTFSTIRYFRAVVKNEICNQQNSNVVTISYPSTTWNGSVWSNGAPNASVRAIFNGNYSSVGNLYACSVQVNSGAITFNSNHTLIVTNEVTVSGGTVFFEDRASLVQINDSLNTGNITFKRNTLPMKQFDYTYWSSPVYPQTLVGLSPSTPSDKYYKFDPVVDNWVGVASNALMDIGKGYIIRAPISFDPVVPSVYNGVFYGTPNNGNFSTPIVVSTSDYNLIGNPYPSALSADLFLSEDSNVPVVDATIYLWTHNTPITANQYTSNDYAVYNYLGGTGTSSAPNLGVNTYVPNGKIASGQSFFIQGLTNGNVVFKNSMRIVGNNDQFFRMNSNPETAIQEVEKHRIWLDVVDGQGAYKQTLVGYSNQATLGIDRGYDGVLLDVGNSTTLYSLSDSIMLSIQGRPLPFSDNDEIDLGFSSSLTGNFQISLYNFDGLFVGQNIYLKDRDLNVIHDLKESPYSFISNSGTFNSRFAIVFKNSTLSNNQNSFSANSVVVYKPNQNLSIDTGNVIMKEVKVYDVRGRMLFDKKGINSSNTSINVGNINEVLLIQIISVDNDIVVKKYVN